MAPRPYTSKGGKQRGFGAMDTQPGPRVSRTARQYAEDPTRACRPRGSAVTRSERRSGERGRKRRQHFGERHRRDKNAQLPRARASGQRVRAIQHSARGGVGGCEAARSALPWHGFRCASPSRVETRRRLDGAEVVRAAREPIGWRLSARQAVEPRDFALVYRGHKQGWDVPNARNRVDFDGLVEALRKHWDAISGRFPNVDEITVIGIDLTKRPRGPSPARRR